MDEAAIQKHVHPWQQILAFIARTQVPHDWTSPKYGMTARQRKKWRQLWQLTGQGPRSSPNPMDHEPDDPQMAAWAITDIEKACLEFCIKLLNQRHRSHEYESALVCAMAVLGQGETSWRDPKSYPPILSRVIKIARFMVVQKALWMDPDPWQIIQTWEKKDWSAEWVLASADNTLEDIDEGYNSDDAIAP
jgi:transposase-like protein